MYACEVGALGWEVEGVVLCLGKKDLSCLEVTGLSGKEQLILNRMSSRLPVKIFCSLLLLEMKNCLVCVGLRSATTAVTDKPATEQRWRALLL